METENTLGIWMDHSAANLIDLNSPENSHTISSEFTHEFKEGALQKNEDIMHNKRQQMHESY